MLRFIKVSAEFIDNNILHSESELILMTSSLNKSHQVNLCLIYAKIFFVSFISSD